MDCCFVEEAKLFPESQSSRMTRGGNGTPTSESICDAGSGSRKGWWSSKPRCSQFLFFQSFELLLNFPLSPLPVQEGKRWEGDIHEFLLPPHSTRITCIHCGSSTLFLFPTAPHCVHSSDTQTPVGFSGDLHISLGQIWRERDSPSYSKDKNW